MWRVWFDQFAMHVEALSNTTKLACHWLFYAVNMELQV